MPSEPDRRCGACLAFSDRQVPLSAVRETTCSPDIFMDLPFWVRTGHPVGPFDGSDCPVWRPKEITDDR